ncbi:Bacteriophage protein [Mycobacteroides abscessus subsp. massiliense]|uniref:hypothetical protein n=1 Tax=Mycobacteroides abscessus TaxID=36809 RepID=UPI0009A59693|nr:hypothetical protein [Mycobacteroides abscessus]SKM80960.1 Bacteriophage protein [Mycobacteroides abscessus subsp. massiliense]SKM97302.1 Bacteriophage protein [Mycobacteroides abscessus subsp. massiliense]SKN76202.1 Bacteriophage protein [Mycobacteroides abscessus subsp. massiliense]SKN96973.1 Bacteriophage protein [Mycobacteroides abscessus subsp. massiliense]SKO20885.1 Bacteriophage protein [Mycobacteroides abscessus subsp. massiliense]
MRFIRQAELAAYDDWDKLRPALQGLETRLMYITPDGFRYDLYGGPLAGRQGVHLAEEFDGEHHWPFELLLSEGAYEMGATVERVNVLKREINLGVKIGGRAIPYNNYQYRMAESRWWQGQDEERDGWLGVYTRYSGWRWLRVRPAKTVSGSQKRDPVAFGNNFASWNLTWIAQKPYYSKPSFWKTWQNTHENAAHFTGGGEGVVTLANRGDLTSYPQFIVPPGTCWVEDGNSDRMVPLPLITANDGYVLVDTDPTARTLTASNDPVDNIFYKIARQSKILDFFLHDLAASGEPIWKRFDKRFMSGVAPKTIAQIRVKHSDPQAKITVILPQRYKRSR